MKSKYLLQSLIFFLISCFANTLFSQNKAVIDSLENALAKAKSHKEKASLLSDLNKSYIPIDSDKAKIYRNWLIAFADSSKDNYVYSEAYFAKASYAVAMRNHISPDSLFYFMKQALYYAEKSGSPKMLTTTNLYLGVTYMMYGKDDSALIQYNKTIELCEKFDEPLNLGAAYYHKARHYHKTHYFEEAIKYYLLSDSIQSKYDQLKPGLVETYLEIAAVFIDIEDYKKAEEYAKKAHKIAMEDGFKYFEIASEMTLANIAYRKDEYEVAEKKYNYVLEYYIAEKDKPREVQTLLRLAHIYTDQNLIEKASEYYSKALNVSREINHKTGMISSLMGLADTKKEKRDYTASIQFYMEALEISQNISDIFGQVECLLNLADLKYKTQDYKASSNYYQAYIPLKDSLDYRKNIEKTQELETKYQSEKKQQQIELLSAENELAQQKRRNQFALLASIILLLAAGAFAWIYYNRNKIKTAAKIKELNELKSRFFANISHEFRTPLTLIKSPLQNLQTEISDQQQKKQLSLIDKNSNRMLELVDQLLELSKLDSGKLQLILKEGNIALFLKSITEPFAYQAQEKGLQFSSQIQNAAENHLFDKDVIQKIVSNLLSNAIKYTPNNQEINFTSQIENQTLKINVSNSGTILQTNDLPKLFERFHQKDSTQNGFGIGLALVKELVELYQGTVEPTLKNGVLNFSVNLPLSQATNENIIIANKTEAAIAEISNIETPSGNELPILLIVEDNAEIRTVVQQIFEKEYQVLQAEDGKTALKIAQKEIPDCIISDVMMPEMDGFEFTQQIKTNELTSFIPVILLTAKTSDEARLKSLKSTADAFLTKPFNNEILKETVRQQITERKKLQERYSQELVLKPMDITINSLDEQFLEKLSKVMESHLQNPNFSTDDFASELAMSRMQLHRKLKTLLNVTTTEFIRNERLKAAAELMKKGNSYITEIAYTVGFNDVSYFSKCFKEVYGETPKEYIANL